MKEIWLPILGYEGLYAVSNIGNVKSLDRIDKSGHKRKEKILKPSLQSSNYILVCLYKNGEKTYHWLHRLVWEAFNGPIPDGMQVNHINEDKMDNRVENLNLMTPIENINWGTRNKKASKSLTNRADLSKTVLQYTKEGVLVKEYESTHQAERETGINQGNISSCCLGRANHSTAGGFKWVYKK